MLLPATPTVAVAWGFVAGAAKSDPEFSGGAIRTCSAEQFSSTVSVPVLLTLKPYLMVRPIFRAYVFSSGPPRFAPGGGAHMVVERTATPRLVPPSEAGGAVRLH